MRAGRDAPVIGRDQIRRAERAPAVARGAEHHVANIPREDLAPDKGHRVRRAGAPASPGRVAASSGQHTQVSSPTLVMLCTLVPPSTTRAIYVPALEPP